MDIQMMDGNPQGNLPFKHCKSPKKAVFCWYQRYCLSTYTVALTREKRKQPFTF
jgi:hypothetical protein